MRPGERLAALRAAGYQVKVRHERPYWESDARGWEYLTRHEAEQRWPERDWLVVTWSAALDWLEAPAHAGRTVVGLRDPSGIEVTAEARCSAAEWRDERGRWRRDQFSRRRGLELALDRALAGLRFARAAERVGTIMRESGFGQVSLSPETTRLLKALTTADAVASRIGIAAQRVAR